jgi:hypothetical protein
VLISTKNACRKNCVWFDKTCECAISFVKKFLFYIIQMEAAKWSRSSVTWKKWKKNHLITLSISQSWNNKHGLPPGTNSMVLDLPNLQQLSSSNNKYLISPHSICWCSKCHNLQSKRLCFFRMSSVVLCHIIKWFVANILCPKCRLSNIIKYITNNSPLHALSTGYNEK